MKHSVSVIFGAAILLLCLLTPALADNSAGGIGGGSGSAYAVAYSQVAIPVPIATPPPGEGAAENFSKLLISPQYLSFSLKPGDVKELTITVTNKGSAPVTLTPKFTDIPYGGPYAMESTWLTITPSEAVVAPGEKARIAVRMAAPPDTFRGYYSGQIALTGEQYPSPSGMPYPNYVQVVTISTEIVAPPVISINPSMLGAALEAGKSYDYEVVLKNNGNTPLSINPTLTMGMIPVSVSGTGVTTLTDDAFSISAPGAIPAQGEVSLQVHIDVPADAGGTYNGMINLGTDDPSVREGEGAIQLFFMVWKQPAAPFSRSFTMNEDVPLTVELTATKDLYSFPVSTVPAGGLQVEPSFDLIMQGPDGVVTPKLVKTVMKGSVDLLTGDPYMVATDTGPYRESGVQYISTYSIPGKAGRWELGIMPHNMARFEYIISMGPLKDMVITPFTPATTALATQTILNLTHDNSTGTAGIQNQT